MTPDVSRRFAGIGRVYGNSALARFSSAHVCVVGIGGVGSWAAEALARSAIGQITLIDPDTIAESNTNRQIHALGDNYGKAKTTVMAERLYAINPACRINVLEKRVTPETLAPLLGGGFDFVIDAIDQVHVKAAMIAWCRQHRQALITSGGAGGLIDPAHIRIDDLARTFQDPLLAKVRSLLRKEYDFPRDPKQKFGIPAVFSSEPLRPPENAADSVQPGSPGFGASPCVTAPFGLFAVGEVLRRLGFACG